MRRASNCPWYWRLFYGFACQVLTLILAMAFVVVRDFYQEPGLHWSNGGEGQIVAYLLTVGGATVLATYIFFVVPLVLLWPPRSQLRHWFLVVLAAILWPVLLITLSSRPGSFSVLSEGLRGSLGEYRFTSVFAVFSAGCYLLLLKQHLREE